MSTDNKYTPKTISESALKFSIPLYQRLFEWDELQIKQLLVDLYTSYAKNSDEPYYIGLLTVYKKRDEESISLVDGQQRFTVLTLMAIAFENLPWKNFLKVGVSNRLTFTSRKSDNSYLSSQIENVPQAHINKKMSQAISIIKDYVAKLEGADRELFIEYIYNKATFFISHLPENYSSQDLNRYFESMNSAGKGLENHEILKVNLLKILPDEKKNFCTKMWNSVSQMDKCLIRQRIWKGESVEQFRSRFYNAIHSGDDQVKMYSFCNDSENKFEDITKKTIRDIASITVVPNKQISSQNDRAILNFDEFLLQVLYMQITDKEAIKGLDFFNTHKLQQTFSKFVNTDNVLQFMENLLKYRVLFDNYIVRISQIDSGNISYTLNFRERDLNASLSSLIQYQSMLYVSTSSYLWLSPTLYFLENTKPTNIKVILDELKVNDNKRHKLAPILEYGQIDRYWFWRLDYYLWENRETYFNGKLKEIADKYVFKANRSIEHIAPQHPKRETEVIVNPEYLHSFGNLAMISAGQNSSLQNESFEVKRAYIESFVNGTKGGSIECLKMLKIYDFPQWNEDSIIIHEDEMIAILNETLLIEIPTKLKESQN
ncbi:MAG: DUF262 domain-containing HNH endonuclease family protein [Flavobacterium sp.]|nr:DUF262 domain-containing HNH endonuclease family protein [Flavobacterium sp.]